MGQARPGRGGGHEAALLQALELVVLQPGRLLISSVALGLGDDGCRLALGNLNRGAGLSVAGISLDGQLGNATLGVNAKLFRTGIGLGHTLFGLESGTARDLLGLGTSALAKNAGFCRGVLDHFVGLLFGNTQGVLEGRTEVGKRGLGVGALENATQVGEFAREALYGLLSR
jgi:hypothetical protein